MSFVAYVKRLRRSHSPQPFSSDICCTILEILESSKADKYSTSEQKLKVEDTDTFIP